MVTGTRCRYGEGGSYREGKIRVNAWMVRQEEKRVRLYGEVAVIGRWPLVEVRLKRTLDLLSDARNKMAGTTYHATNKPIPVSSDDV